MICSMLLIVCGCQSLAKVEESIIPCKKIPKNYPTKPICCANIVRLRIRNRLMSSVVYRWILYDHYSLFIQPKNRMLPRAFSCMANIKGLSRWNFINFVLSVRFAKSWPVLVAAAASHPSSSSLKYVFWLISLIQTSSGDKFDKIALCGWKMHESPCFWRRFFI